MEWEEIDNQARQMAVQAIRQLTGEETKQEEESDEILRKMMTTRLFTEERSRRNKYDGNKAFRKMQRKKKLYFIRRIGAIACSFFLILGSIWFFTTERHSHTNDPLPIYGIHDRQQIFLQLSDGQRIALSSKDTMRLWEANHSIEVHNGKITYTGGPDQTEERQNTLSVPPGGEFQIRLADGTLVHLNADSELSYPLAFSSKERRVHLRGEAWFEVAKNSDLPFYVVAEDVEIHVYGTSFNVNTHGRKTIQTVLAEGHIGIRSLDTAEEIEVRPGQLAEYGRIDRTIRLREVNVRQYTAWKDGFFYFDDKTLEEIMEELARWYDMEIDYRSERGRTLRFSGHLQRYKDVRKILAIVTESVGIRFHVTGKQIVVD